jgi:hypothetical protein
MPEAEADQRDEQEIARRRDEVLKRLMQMPPKRHEEMKLGRVRRKASVPSAHRKQAPTDSL